MLWLIASSVLLYFFPSCCEVFVQAHLICIQICTHHNIVINLPCSLCVPVLTCTEDKLVLSGGRPGRYDQTLNLAIALALTNQSLRSGGISDLGFGNGFFLRWNCLLWFAVCPLLISMKCQPNRWRKWCDDLGCSLRVLCLASWISDVIWFQLWICSVQDLVHSVGVLTFSHLMSCCASCEPSAPL